MSASSPGFPARCRAAAGRRSSSSGPAFIREQPVRRVEIVVDGHRFSPRRRECRGWTCSTPFIPVTPKEGSIPGRVDRSEIRSDDDPLAPLLQKRVLGHGARSACRSRGDPRSRSRATLADGTSVDGELARITAVESRRRVRGLHPRAPASRSPWPLTTPTQELFRAQIDRSERQTMEDWICLISDDCTPPAQGRRDALGDRGRRTVHLLPGRSAPRLLQELRASCSSWRPQDVPYIALADQDDRWYPEKLQALLDGLGDANLVYSDQRLVDPDGRVLADTYWTGRRNNHTNLASLLIANTITGAASLFRRDLLSLALPFPETPGTQYHDQWLGLVALSTGRINYVDRPLYDYVQHGAAALGHTAANPRSAGARVTFTRIGSSS